MASFEQPGLDTEDYDTWRQKFLQGSRDWASGELPWGIPEHKFFPYGCTFCHRGPFVGVKLSRCTKCKMAYYCSKTCQKEHATNQDALMDCISDCNEQVQKKLKQ